MWIYSGACMTSSTSRNTLLVPLPRAARLLNKAVVHGTATRQGVQKAMRGEGKRPKSGHDVLRRPAHCAQRLTTSRLPRGLRPVPRLRGSDASGLLLSRRDAANVLTHRKAVCAIRGSSRAKLLHDLGVVFLIGGFVQLLFHHHVIAQHLFVHFLLQRLSFRLVITGIQQRF
jgi:hypothetical protein